ncbi:Hypp7259 [Branchiostoma lanceolatum]|uniref:Hypp7259 protein n=1 Tax=Branchiostoma lanceolatum TaxID=7740 RepID=A0A8J9YZ94_BRALA|nr:Hypp7259 [Branchiostoma lanceolatum]
MLLNPKKCKVLQICFMKRSPPAPVFTLGIGALTVVKQARLLGLQIQCDLGWDAQVDSIVSKGSRRLFLLLQLLFRQTTSLPSTGGMFVHFSSMQPQFGTPPSTTGARQTNRLEGVQKRACKIVLGGQYTSYIAKL